jgi:hypothetical protein
VSAPKLTEAQRTVLAKLAARKDGFVLHNAVPMHECRQLYALGFTMCDWKGMNHRITDAGRAALRGES